MPALRQLPYEFQGPRDRLPVAARRLDTQRLLHARGNPGLTDAVRCVEIENLLLQRKSLRGVLHPVQSVEVRAGRPLGEEPQVQRLRVLPRLILVRVRGDGVLELLDRKDEDARLESMAVLDRIADAACYFRPLLPGA